MIYTNMYFFIQIVIFIFFSSSALSGIIPPVHKILDNGEPNAVIQHNEFNRISKFLQHYIKESTGVTIPLESTSLKSQDQEHIHLTIEQKTNHLLSVEIFKKYEGFLIDFSQPNHIWLKGYSKLGLEFAVYEFLELFLGIRWLFPGKLGEFIPQNKALIIQSKNIIQFPAFAVRHLGGLKNSIALTWAKRHRMGERINLSHNLHNIFPINSYLKTYPYIYPQKKGKTDIPFEKVGWQPCFKNPKTIDIAVDHIKSLCKKNPAIQSFSLSTNDAFTATSGFCESDYNKITYNSWGYPNASDFYYQWTNIVVQKVLEKYPNKLFGTLAYMETASAPNKFRLNDHIITFLTEDRLRWVNPSCDSKARQWVDEWSKQSKNIGFYDYFYGTPYVLPRIYFHHMASIYRYAYEKGVIAVCAEAYPNWGEGPKLYLAMKLFWNPWLEVDNLLNDWYVCCVGKHAAKYLSQYFSLWESFWMKIDKTKWFYNKSMYMAFWSPSYLNYAQLSDIQQSRYLLEKTVIKAQTHSQKMRARFFLNAFEYYEASAISYWGLESKQYNISTEKAEEMNKKRYLLIQKFEKDPLLIHSIRFDKNTQFPKLQW